MKTEEEPEQQKDVPKGRLVAATQFKKKMAREVRDIVEDNFAADAFLKNIAQKKLARKRRNIAAMIAKSTTPDKPLTDFVRANMEDFAENQEIKKQQKV